MFIVLFVLSTFAAGPRLAWHRLLRHAVLAVAALATSTQALAAAPDGRFQAAFEQFQAATRGDAAAAQRAAALFDALLKEDPANPLLLAYQGAATSMKARDAWMPWNKMGYAEDGLAQIDKALALLRPAHDAPVPGRAPSSLETRFVAANTFLGMPGFFNRGPRGAALLAQVQSSPLLAQSAPGFQGAVLMRAAQLALQNKHADEARRDLDEVIRRGLPQADAAAALLKELPR